MEIIVTVVLGVLALIAAAVQIHYARKQVVSPAAAPSAPAVVQNAALGPECRYLVVEGYTNKTWEAEKIDVSWATVTVDGETFHYDGGDITPNRAFVLKGYQPGTYLVTADFKFHQQPDYMNRHYAADIVLDDSSFYLLKWEPYTTHYGPPDTRFVSVESISEELFRQMMSINMAVLPSCKALRKGVTRF